MPNSPMKMGPGVPKIFGPNHVLVGVNVGRGIQDLKLSTVTLQICEILRNGPNGSIFKKKKSRESVSHVYIQSRLIFEVKPPKFHLSKLCS